jgi:hypothetical protein
LRAERSTLCFLWRQRAIVAAPRNSLSGTVPWVPEARFRSPGGTLTISGGSGYSALIFLRIYQPRFGCDNGMLLALVGEHATGAMADRRQVERDMELRDRWVSFKIRDVSIPDSQTLLMELHGDDILQGKTIDLSDSGTKEEAFVVVEVEGVAQPVIIAVSRLLAVM